MKSAGLFLFTILFTATLAAQATTAPVVEPPGADPADVATVKNTTVRGCLHSANDNYTVIDQVSGKTYKISGDTTKLKQHIGQMVEISGETQTIDGPNPPAESSTGDTLALGDIRELADSCPSGQSALQSDRMLLAQQRANDDANTQLNSSEPFSSNTADTSSVARRSSTVTTRQQTSREVDVSGHAGQHQTAVPTSTTGSATQTTPATNAAPTGYNTTHPSGSGGGTQAVVPSERNKTAPVPGDSVTQSGGRNPALTGNTPEEADRAAQAAGRAEMRTNPQTGKTTFSTMPGTQSDDSSQANPKIQKKPEPNKTRTNSEAK